MPTYKLPHNQTDLHYTDRPNSSGSDADDVLVLLNGMSQSTSNWLSQIRPLAEHMRVIAYDARGQGRSGLGPTPIQLDDHVADLIALLDGLGIDKVSLAGFSHGSRIALRTAALHPDRIHRLALTSIGAHRPALARTIVEGWHNVLRLGGLEALAWCAIPNILGESFLATSADMLPAIARATVQRNSLEGLSALLEGLQGYSEPIADAAAVSCPTCVIVSDADLMVPVRQAELLVDAIAGAELIHIADSGHTIPIEQPEAWRAALLGFLLER